VSRGVALAAKLTDLLGVPPIFDFGFTFAVNVTG
jgi:hypothetical protein